MPRTRLTFVSIVSLLALLVGMLPAIAVSAGAGTPAGPAAQHRSPEFWNSLPFVASGDSAGAQLTAMAPPSNNPGTVRSYPTYDVNESGYVMRPFVLRSISPNTEVWVAQDLNFPGGDCRNPVEVAQSQADFILGEFDYKISPNNTAYFGEPKKRNGSKATLPGRYNLPGDYYAGSDRTIILMDNIRDENYYDQEYPNFIVGFFSGSFALGVDRNIITVDAFDWEHRIGVNPPDDPTSDPCTSRPARPYLYESTIAHEYQHLIHFDYDPNELSWVDEGMADLAEAVNGYAFTERNPPESGANAHIQSFFGNARGTARQNGQPVQIVPAGPENSLPLWGDQGPREILADYGIAFAFMLYVDTQFGGAPFMRAWHNSDLQGIAGFEAALKTFGYNTTFTQVYRDFAVAMVVDRMIDDGLPGGENVDRYRVNRLRAQINVDTDQAFSTPGAPPYGADYVRIIDPQLLNDVRFKGADKIVRGMQWTSRGAGPAGWTGGAVLHSGHQDANDAWLARQVTLGPGTQTLSFDTYYDIEECWDYGVVQVSTDGGKTFTSLKNADTTDCKPADGGQDPRVTAQLPGFTGQTPAWKRTSFDLSAYAGQTVILAFRYITDPATGGNDNDRSNNGWWIDNITINATVLSDGANPGDFGDVTFFQPIATKFSVQLVGVGASSFVIMQLPLTPDTFEGRLTPAQLEQFYSSNYIIAVIIYEAPTGADNVGPGPDYAPYELTVTRLGVTETMPGGR